MTTQLTEHTHCVGLSSDLYSLQQEAGIVADKLKNAEAVRRYRQRHPKRNAEASARYRERNPEKVVESKARWYRERGPEKNREARRLKAEKYPGKALESTRRWRAKNPEKNRESNLLSKRKTLSTPLGRVTHTLIQARLRAQRVGRPFSITVTDLLPFPEHCPVFGIRLNYQGGKKRGFVDDSASIDRVDPAKGYVPGNVRIVCWRANRIKCDATIDELEAVLRYMRGTTHDN